MLMGDWLQRLRNSARGARVIRRGRRRLASPAAAQVQSLEPRLLLSATIPNPGNPPTPPIIDIPVNVTTAGTQTTAPQSPQAVAVDGDGDWVVVYTGTDGSGTGVFARRFDKNGTAVGGEILINQETNGNQSNATVACDIDGDFVVTWTSNGNTSDPGSNGVFARSFDRNGNALGIEFRVNAFTTGNQQNSVIAMDESGDYVIAWQSANQVAAGSGYDIYAQRFNAAGVRVGTQTEFLVNQFTTGNQVNASVAISRDGDFVITWSSANQETAGSGYGVYALAYDRNGNAKGLVDGNEFQVNSGTTVGNQFFSDVAIDTAGDFVITWTSGNNQDGNGYGVFAQRYKFTFNANPVLETVTTVGTEFQVNTNPNNTTGAQRYSTVAMDYAGNFVITFASNAPATGLNNVGTPPAPDTSGYGIYAKQYNANGTVAVGEQLVNIGVAGDQTFPSVAMDFRGDFTVAWTGVDASGAGVFAQRFVEGSHPDTFPPIVTGVLVNGDTLNNNEVLLSPVSTIQVTFSENLVTAGVNSITNLSNWTFTQKFFDDANPGGINVAVPINSITFAIDPTTQKYTATLNLPTLLQSGDYTLTLASNVFRDTSGNILDGDLDHVAGGTIPTINFQIRSAHSYGTSTGTGAGVEQQVSSSTTGNKLTEAQGPQSIAVDGNGNYVVTWVETTIVNDPDAGDPDLAFFSIYARRFDQNGNAINLGGSTNPLLVATGAANTVSNTTTSQRAPAVAMDAAGDIVITWTQFRPSNAVDPSNVFFRRFNSSGNSVGGTQQANATSLGGQQNSTVALDSSGNFIIAWSSNSPSPTNPVQDGSGYGVYAQRYSSAGAAVGTEFQVNLFTTNSQGLPTIAYGTNGRFAIAWSSNSEDGSGQGVYVRQFNQITDPANPGGPPLLDGIPELRVNTFTTGDQHNPMMAMNASGDMIVSWMSTGQDGSSEGVYAQRINRGGQLVGNEFRVNQLTSGSQQLGRVGIDADGDFVIAYMAPNQDSSAYGVFATKYDRLGNQLGTEFQVNNFVTGDQRIPAVGMNAQGEFVVAWTSDGQDAPSTSGIYAQLYRFGNRPTDVTLTQAPQFSNLTPISVPINSVSGTFVATLGTADLDVGDNATFQLVSGAGNADNGSFQIIGNQLFTLGTLPNQASYSIRVRAIDAGGLTFEKKLTITAAPANVGPTIVIQTNNFPNGIPQSTDTSLDVLIATYTVDDPDGVGTTQIALSGADANLFKVVPNPLPSPSGNQVVSLYLIGGTNLDAEANPTLDVTITVSDPTIPTQSVPNSTSLSLNVTRPAQTPPVIANFGGNVSYAEGGAGTQVSSTVTITDNDSPDFNVGQLVVHLANGVPTDVLFIQSTGSSTGQVSVVGSNVFFEGILVGTFTGGTNGADLVVTFNHNSSAAAAEAILRAVTFKNSGQNPTTQTRTITATVSDGDYQQVGDGTDVSNTVSKQITVSVVNDPPSITQFDQPVTYNLGDPPALLDFNAIVNDPDSPDLSGGKLTISYTQNGQSTDRLSFNTSGPITLQSSNVLYFDGVNTKVVGTFTGGAGTTPLVITFNANSSPAAATAVLDNITYRNVGTTPSPATRQVKAVITDGDGGTSTAVFKTINLTKIDQPPAIGNLSTNVVFTKVSGPQAIGASATVSDSDTPVFNGGVMTVTIIGGQPSDVLFFKSPVTTTGSTVKVSSVAVGTFSGGTGGAPLVINLNANATIARVQTLLRNITFSNTTTPLTAGIRTIQVTVSDGAGATSPFAQGTVSVQLLAPVVSNFNTSPTTVAYTEGNAPVIIAGATTVTDPDANTTTINNGKSKIAGWKLTLALTANGEAADVLGIQTSGPISVTGSTIFYSGVAIATFTGGTNNNPLVVTFNSNIDTGTLTTRLSKVNAVIQHFTYSSTSTNPSNLNRSVQLTVTDEDGQSGFSSQKTIQVTPVNSAPVIGNFGGTVVYDHLAGPAPHTYSTNYVLLDSDATVTDADMADFNNGQLTVQLVNNIQSTDVLFIRNQGIGAGQVGVSGNNITYGGTVIGTFAGGTGATPLVITFNSNADATAVQAVLRNIAYSSTSTNPTVTQKTVNVSLTDGDGGTSNTVSGVISVI